MVKEIKIAGKTYTFKENLVGLDVLATLKDNSPEKKALKSTIGLIARASENPKLSSKDVVMLPYGEFVLMIKEFSDVYGVPAEFDFLDGE